MKLRIDISLEGGNRGDLREGYGNFRFTEELEFPVMTFTEICSILGQFQVLAQRIKEKGQ